MRLAEIRGRRFLAWGKNGSPTPLPPGGCGALPRGDWTTPPSAPWRSPRSPRGGARVYTNAAHWPPERIEVRDPRTVASTTASLRIHPHPPILCLLVAVQPPTPYLTVQGTLPLSLSLLILLHRLGLLFSSLDVERAVDGLASRCIVRLPYLHGIHGATKSLHLPAYGLARGHSSYPLHSRNDGAWLALLPRQNLVFLGRARRRPL